MVRHEIASLLACLYAGLLLGAIFDLLQMLRHIFRAGQVLTAIADLLFWLIASAIALGMLRFVSSGQLRFFLLAAMAAGAALYALLIFPLTQRLLCRAEKLFARLLPRSLIKKLLR